MIVGRDGLSVVLSAETAYYIDKLCNGAGLRQRLRDGRHQRVSQELLDLREAAMSFDPARLAIETQDARPQTQVASELNQGLMSVAEVADLLGLSGAAVRQACLDGRLEAEQAGPGRRWRITRQAYEDYRTARAA